MAIEAVIWDFGGVFTTSPFEAFNRYEARHGIPKDFIRTVNATHPDANAWALFERAELDREGFDAKFLEEARALGHSIPGADVLPLLSGEIRPRMVAALKACKARFKVGCITNNMVQGHGPGMAASVAGGCYGLRIEHDVYPAEHIHAAALEDWLHPIQVVGPGNPDCIEAAAPADQERLQRSQAAVVHDLDGIGQVGIDRSQIERLADQREHRNAITHLRHHPNDVVAADKAGP